MDSARDSMLRSSRGRSGLRSALFHAGGVRCLSSNAASVLLGSLMIFGPRALYAQVPTPAHSDTGAVLQVAPQDVPLECYDAPASTRNIGGSRECRWRPQDSTIAYIGIDSARHIVLNYRSLQFRSDSSRLAAFDSITATYSARFGQPQRCAGEGRNSPRADPTLLWRVRGGTLFLTTSSVRTGGEVPRGGFGVVEEEWLTGARTCAQRIVVVAWY
jgi:hypothetical protein